MQLSFCNASYFQLQSQTFSLLVLSGFKNQYQMSPGLAYKLRKEKRKDIATDLVSMKEADSEREQYNM